MQIVETLKEQNTAQSKLLLEFYDRLASADASFGLFRSVLSNQGHSEFVYAVQADRLVYLHELTEIGPGVDLSKIQEVQDFVEEEKKYQGASHDIRECNNGIARSCYAAAVILSDKTVAKNQHDSLYYAEKSCEMGVQEGCRVQGLLIFSEGKRLHLRILDTGLSGDPEGVWRYKYQLNEAIERARRLYETARNLDPNLSDDWQSEFDSLNNLRQ